MLRSAPAVSLFVFVGAVAAQGYTTDFETFTASAAGTPTAGQDGFYVPPIAGSNDGAIFTYAGNTYGIPLNLLGGANFYAGAGTIGICRAQRAVTPPNGTCAIEFDVLLKYIGTATPLQNAGGVSLQPSGTNTYMNLLARWTNPAVTPLTWNADTAFGPTQASVITVLPDPAFQNLAVDVWHRWGVTIDFTTSTYVNWRITNGVTGITTIYTPPAPVPLPGPVSPVLPTDIRFFTGNTNNLFAVDNFTMTFGAEYTTFGTGCPSVVGVPALSVASLPKPGQTLSVGVSNLPVNIGLMITGLSNTLLGGAVPLPLSLASQGFPGCDLLVDVLITDTLVGFGGSATWSLAIPNTNQLLGFTLYNQAAVVDTGAAFLAFSNGGRAVIGL